MLQRFLKSLRCDHSSLHCDLVQIALVCVVLSILHYLDDTTIQGKTRTEASPNHQSELDFEITRLTKRAIEGKK